MDKLVHLLFSVSAVLPEGLAALAGVIAAASAVAALTPTPRDDRFLGRLYRIVDLLALNIGHAKDRPETRSDGRP